MKFSKFRFLFFTIGLLSLLAVLIVVIMGTKLAPIEQALGGNYSGLLPGFGQVQIDLFFPDSSYLDARLYKEGAGQQDFLDIITVSNGLLHGEVVGNHGSLTNATIDFQFMNSGGVMKGWIAQPNAESNQFVPLRVFEHLAVRRSSGSMFGRLGAYANYCGEFPSIKSDSPFHTA